MLLQAQQTERCFDLKKKRENVVRQEDHLPRFFFVVVFFVLEF